MKLIVREISADEVEQDITQRDAFNTDNVGLAEALARESHQNSTDGESGLVAGGVRTRVRVVEALAEDAAYWRSLFEPLLPHLEACDVATTGVNVDKPWLLVIEDFGTTGLTGAVDRKDNGNFSDFWRRVGVSHKSGQRGGRWGLGKLVFSSASKLRTFFGLTIRDDDPTGTAYLMGQAVLENHVFSGPPEQEFAPHAFFALEGANRLQVPDSDPASVMRFIEASGITRRGEPGLSIVVPFVHPEITTEAILPHIVRNWFVPILAGKLTVELGGYNLDASTLADLARAHGGAEFQDGKRVGFVAALHAARSVPPIITLSESWTSDGVESVLPDAALEELRQQFRDGELIGVRAPITLRPKVGPVVQTYIDVYLKSELEIGPGIAFFVRGAMSVPGEARKFNGRNCFGAMVAEHAPIAAFLGDAEGPAHTSWSGTAEKLTKRWQNAGARLKEIRAALNAFHLAVASPSERSDPDALINFFNVPSAGAVPRKPKPPIIRKPKVPPIKAKPKSYGIEQRKNGFVVRGSPSAVLPMQVTVAVAYDVIDGNALTQYSKYDFELSSKDIRIEAKGATFDIMGDNRMKITGKESGFTVTVTGFDENRDLFLRDRKV